MAEIIVALDLPDRTEALRTVDRLGPEVDFVKVGLELFVREGPAMVRELRDRGVRVFLDLKLHDIPRTVERAVRSASALDVDLLTVHASGGRRMLEAASSGRSGGLRLLAVTVLTSLDGPELADSWGRSHAEPATEVVRLADLATEAGIDGVVSSPLEARTLADRLGPGAPIVTPGIRMEGSPAGDQRRIATPREAVSAGATHLVVGRTVTAAPDPRGALEAIRSDVRASAGSPA